MFSRANATAPGTAVGATAPLQAPGTSKGAGYATAGIAPRPARKGGTTSRFSTMEATALVLIPWLAFVCVCLLFAFAYHGFSALVWLLIIGAVCACGAKFKTHMRDRSLPFPLCLSVFCLNALIASTVAGLVAWDLYISNYWYYTTSHSYVNVLPSSAAGGYADAGELVFADEAHIDADRALGYQDGSRYCVAPILDDAFLEQVQFWAVGVDCCAQRGAFHCDDAWNPEARSAVVLHPETSRYNRETHEQYHLAVRQAEAAYDIVSAADPIFVRFVIDPELVTLNSWRNGSYVLLVTAMVFLLYLMMVTYAVQTLDVNI